MPTYTYRCQACEHQFDQFQRMSDAPLTECPVCGGTVKRVIHPVGVVFKGSGWYITDSRKPAPSENGAGEKAGKGEKTEAKAGAGKGEKADTTKTAKEPAKAG